MAKQELRDSGFWIKTLPTDIEGEDIEEVDAVDEGQSTEHDATTGISAPQSVEEEHAISSSEVTGVSDLDEVAEIESAEEDSFEKMPLHSEPGIELSEEEADHIEDLPELDSAPLSEEELDSALDTPFADAPAIETAATDSGQQGEQEGSAIETSDNDSETATLEFEPPPFEGPSDTEMADTIDFDLSSIAKQTKTAAAPVRQKGEAIASVSAAASASEAAPDNAAEADEESDIDIDALSLEEARYETEADEEKNELTDIEQAETSDDLFSPGDPELNLSAFLQNGSGQVASQETSTEPAGNKFTQLEEELANIRSELDNLRHDLATLRANQPVAEPGAEIAPATKPAEAEIADTVPADTDETADIVAIDDEEGDIELSETDMFELPDEIAADTSEEADALQSVDSGFFDSDSSDETIALSDDELDNIMNTADFSESDLDPLELSGEPSDIAPGGVSPESALDMETSSEEPPTAESPAEEQEQIKEIATVEDMDEMTEQQTETAKMEEMEELEPVAAESTAKLIDTPPTISSLPEDVSITGHAPHDDSSVGMRKEELRAIIGYLDQLFGNLPEEKVEEFATSHYFALYKNLFKELELEKS